MHPLTLAAFLSIGLALAFFVLQNLGAKRRAASEDKVMKGYFLLGLSGLMAKIAAADGRVTSDESEMAMRFFSRMDLTDAERAMCIGHFVIASRDDLTARDHAKRFMAYANITACSFLYDMLWRISRADGVVAEAEDRLLGEIAEYLGLGKAVYENFKAGSKPHYDKTDLQVAGVPPSLVTLAG